ncbi:MAG: prephenate dehydrogenase/arogenate dehydrogenase family protein [Halorhabdus sp.]
MDVLVVGSGEMGRWFARVLSTHLETAPTVTFTDVNTDRARDAADTLDGRTVSLDTDERFELVCIAVPIPAVGDAVATQAPKADRAVCDLAGVMAAPVAAMADHAPDCERVSFHPLFAPTNAPGNVPLVPDEPGPVTDRVRVALSAAGNDLFETTPAEHDSAMQTVQARTHAAILAFGLAAEPVPDRFQTPISAGLFELLETVTGGEARVYADIQAAFAGATDVATAAQQVADADAASFDDLYERARRQAHVDDE